MHQHIKEAGSLEQRQVWDFYRHFVSSFSLSTFHSPFPIPTCATCLKQWHVYQTHEHLQRPQQKKRSKMHLTNTDSFQQSLAYSFYKQKWKMCEHYPVSLWHNCIWLWQHRSVLTICIILHPCLWHPCLSRATIFMRLLHSISEPGFSDHLQENQHHTVLRRIQKDSWMTYRFSGSSVPYSICISLPLSYLPDKHSHYHVLSFDFFLLNENWIQYNIWIML